MTNASEPALSAPFEPNSICAIRERVAEGRITWSGPLLLVVMRPALWMAAQGLVALIFLAQHRLHPWRQATYWWSVCFTVADIACILAMLHLTRKEGMRLRDLFGPIRMRHGHDIFLGLGFFLLAFPFYMAGGFFSQRVFYGSRPNPTTYILHLHALPLWAIVYSLAIWWIVNSATEEATYQAYVLPRLQALTGRTWMAAAVVGFFFTAQHCAVGFIPDWRSIACRFFAFLPGCLVMIGLYLRTRRLMPLIIAHWPMDLAAVLMTAVW